MTSSPEELLIAEPAAGVRVAAESGGVWIRATEGDLTDPSVLRSLRPTLPLGRVLPSLIPQLLELGLATSSDGTICIAHSDFVELEQHGIDAFEPIVGWAPFSLELESSRFIGHEGFRYNYRFRLGGQPAYPDRVGSVLRHRRTLYRLDPQTFALLQEIDRFTALDPSQRTDQASALIHFATIKKLGDGVGAQLDRYLEKERVLLPSTLGLDVIFEEGDRISFAPKVDGVPQESMREEFLRFGDVQDVYVVADPDGTRVRVVLDDEQREVLRRMQRVRHLGGRDRARVVKDPHAVFDGVAGKLDIDLSVFGPRVRGIGDYDFATQPRPDEAGTGVLDGVPPGSSAPERQPFECVLGVPYVGQPAEDVVISSSEELRGLLEDLRLAEAEGQPTVTFRGKAVEASERFRCIVEDYVRRAVPTEPQVNEDEPLTKKFLLIHENVEQLGYGEEASTVQGVTIAFDRPGALRADAGLKAHQEKGIAWLQHNYRLQRSGCLLADDMGLGKTLQILVFIAWLLELQEREKREAEQGPILVVAPVILLENGTWLEDMQRFFQDGGRIFEPLLVLHGPALNRLRRTGTGRETILGESVLDVEKLAAFRVILTNYETVTNYQHSFAKMRPRWSAVITDEAQEYKTPNTQVSHALKALDPRFRIASTGTPVETRLLDVWNLFDFLQPGLLGTAKHFTQRFETAASQSAGIPPSLAVLKRELKISTPDAFVLRREKTMLKDLPLKHEHRIDCDLSQAQRQWHLGLVAQARTEDSGRHHLRVISDLLKVYQHPGLMTPGAVPDPQEALRTCPKLQALVSLLHEIKAKGEKVLIFSRFIAMQQLLKLVIDQEFGLEVGIINGSVRRHGETQSSKATRHDILARFRSRPSFDVLVLSPDVAGIGLTITEASHVVHYGRWWNPAKESQATDRAYRIGQTRDVHVYYPIARDPQGEFTSFDERLDALIDRRRRLASEFLAPMPGEDDLGAELLGDLLGESAEGRRDLLPPLAPDEIRELTAASFEALAAVLWAKADFNTVLTPLTGDDGVDVVAIRGGEAALIQCKHSTGHSVIDVDAVEDAVRGIDCYQGKYFRNSSRRVKLEPVLLTNVRLTGAATRKARECGVTLIGAEELGNRLRTSPVTRLDVAAASRRRVAHRR